MSSPIPEIRSIGKTWFQTHFPSYSSEKAIPLSQMDEYTRLIASINRFCSMNCPVIAKSNSTPVNVLVKAHEILSHCCLPESMSAKFRWMVLAYPAVLKQNNVEYTYAFLQTLFTIVSLWNISEWKNGLFVSLWNGICQFYDRMYSKSAERDDYQNIISLSLTVLCSIIRRFPSGLPLSLPIVQSCVKMLHDEDLHSEDLRRNRSDKSIALELFQFLNNASSIFPSLSSEIQTSILVGY